jgi:fibro-slime domain-containing protein
MQAQRALTLACLALLPAQACESKKSGEPAGEIGAAGIDGEVDGGAGADGEPTAGRGMGGNAGTLVLMPPPGGELMVNEGGDTSGPEPGELPPGFTEVDVGGFKLGDRIEGGVGAGGVAPVDPKPCGTTIRAVVRDFTDAHPDFEKKLGMETGLVEPALDANRKPVFAHATATNTVSGPDSFDQWYRNVDGVNLPFLLEIWFEPTAETTSFRSDSFFPLDGQGAGNQGRNHNYHFTTEIHAQFRYAAGQIFSFTGDDDVWIFLNDRLVVDLGGVHLPQSAQIDVDALAPSIGLEVGEVYPFDMFHAERRTEFSNFRADTNLEFVDCGIVVPEIPE